ncbi:MAG: hypothetical protein IJI45_08350, partial [Anaerolineaceae bacterium]|nr:hypothetical protein [Anaerolineaceae bacterium]
MAGCFFQTAQLGCRAIVQASLQRFPGPVRRPGAFTTKLGFCQPPILVVFFLKFLNILLLTIETGTVIPYMVRGTVIRGRTDRITGIRLHDVKKSRTLQALKESLIVVEPGTVKITGRIYEGNKNLLTSSTFKSENGGLIT